MNADGTGVRSYADADVADEEPDFSPDGARIVYSGPFGVGGDGIRVRSTDSSRVRVTVRLLGIAAPSPRRCGGGASRRALARLAPPGRRLWLVIRAGARPDAASRLAALVATASGKQLQVAQLQ